VEVFLTVSDLQRYYSVIQRVWTDKIRCMDSKLLILQYLLQKKIYDYIYKGNTKGITYRDICFRQFDIMICIMDNLTYNLLKII
jgi:hypothetical protein